MGIKDNNMISKSNILIFLSVIDINTHCFTCSVVLLLSDTNARNNKNKLLF